MRQLKILPNRSVSPHDRNVTMGVAGLLVAAAIGGLSAMELLDPAMLLGAGLLVLLVLIYQRNSRVGLLAVVLAFPFFAYERVYWGSFGISVTDLVLWPFLLLFTLQLLRRKIRILGSWELRVLILYFLVRAASGINAAFFLTWMSGQISYWLGLLVFLSSSSILSKNLRLLGQLMKVWMLVAAVLSILGLFQIVGSTFLGVNFLALGKDQRIDSLLTNPNHLAMLLVPASIFALCFFRTSMRDGKFLYGLSLVVITVALFFTRSYGSFVAWGVAVSVFFIRGRLVYSLSKLLIAALCILGVIVVSSQLVDFRVPDFDWTQAWASSANYHLSYRNRIYLVNTAWDMFRAHPVLGVGASHFKMRLDDFKDPRVYRETTASHNTYLSALAETGILGFVGFCVFILLILLKGSRALAVKRKPVDALLLRAALAAFVAHCVYGMTHDMMYGPPVFWLLAGMVWARSCSGSPACQESSGLGS